jgi:uncharacterized protein
MKVLITGATGFVGQYVLEELIRNQHECVIVTRSVEKAKKKIPFPCEIHKWNPLTELLPESALDGVEAVIHLLGENVAAGRWTKKQKNKILDSRELSTQNLMKSIERFGSSIKVVSSASAVGIYPRNHGENSLNEQSSLGEGFLADVCKRWEAPLITSQSSFRKNIFRIGVVFGREDGALKKLLPIFKLGLGGRVASGKQWMSWIHVKDLARAFVYSVENEKMNGIYNGTSPHPVTNLEFTKALASSLSRPAFFPVPAIALKLAMGEMSSIILDSQKIVPDELIRSGFEFKYGEIQAAMNEINLSNRCERLRQFQFVDKPVEDVFKFFSDAHNLERITPSWINFKILSQSTPEIQKDTLFEYALKVRGIPLRWTTHITDWEKNKNFVDYQSKGPYKIWHHTHEFIAYKNGTLMLDDVKYKAPLGLFGELILTPFINMDVNKIFNHRKKIIDEIL